MSTPEEHLADERRDAALWAAYNDGGADLCEECKGLFFEQDLEILANNKPYCADCVDKINEDL